MGSAEQLTKDLVEVVKNEDFTEAVVTLEDGTRLYFCHRVGERWAKSVGPEMQEDEGGLASALLQQDGHSGQCDAAQWLQIHHEHGTCQSLAGS